MFRCKAAYVVTGANGCGKTSLLTALHRMGAPNAFQIGIPGGKTANGIDAINRGLKLLIALH